MGGGCQQDQAGFKNAMVEFDDRRNVVIGVPAGELKRSYLP
jgi:peroxiredoxin